MVNSGFYQGRNQKGWQMTYIMGMVNGREFRISKEQAAELNNDRNGRGDRNVDFKNGFVFRNKSVAYVLPIELYDEICVGVSKDEKCECATPTPTQPKPKTDITEIAAVKREYKSMQQANYHRRTNGLNDTHEAKEREDGAWVLVPK